jgi:hypothetical protein
MLKKYKTNRSGARPYTGHPAFYDDDPQALNAASKEWLLETFEEEEDHRRLLLTERSLRSTLPTSMSYGKSLTELR